MYLPVVIHYLSSSPVMKSDRLPTLWLSLICSMIISMIRVAEARPSGSPGMTRGDANEMRMKCGRIQPLKPSPSKIDETKTQHKKKKKHRQNTSQHANDEPSLKKKPSKKVSPSRRLATGLVMKVSGGKLM